MLKKAISPVISAVILTSVLLVILIVSTFVANNILELKVQSTEFEQAKTNMLLLDEIISEAGVKYGSGSYVQFNLRSGALNIIRGIDKIKVFINNSIEPIIEFQTLNIVYRAGGLVFSSLADLKGSNVLIARGAAASLGYIRIESESPVQIKLDYNRIRVVEVGTAVVNGTERNILQIVFFHLESGSIGGSGIIRIKAQNRGIFVETLEYNSHIVKISVQLGSYHEEYTFVGKEACPTVITIIKSLVEVSA
ncbi:MAG: hypothetical protein QW546_03025 [Candidatus Bathyarchaeia archaeon]